MTNAVPDWNRARVDGQARVPGLNDPVLVAALEHFGGNITNCRLLNLGCSLGEASLFFT